MTALRLVGRRTDAVPMYPTIRELNNYIGQVIDAQFVVDQQLRITEGTPHLRLRFADATSAVLAFIWPEAEAAVTLPALGSAASVRAEVCAYNGKPQFRVRRLAPLAPANVASVANLLPGIPEFVVDALGTMERQLPAILHEFLARVLLDPAIGPAFTTCRASVAHHHSDRGGLLRHSVENLDLIAEMIRRRLPEEPKSAAIGQLAYFFHDVGKIMTVGTTMRPSLSWTARHETQNFMVLAPHLHWLEEADLEACRALLSIFEYLATPAPARKRPAYFPAEVVAQFDGWSAAEFNHRGLAAFMHLAPGFNNRMNSRRHVG